MTVYREKTCACGHAASFHEPGKKRGRCTYGEDRSRFGTTVAPCTCLKFHRRASPAAYADDVLELPPATPTFVHQLASQEPLVLAAIDTIIRGFTELRAALPVRHTSWRPEPMPYVPVNFPLRQTLDEQKAERRKAASSPAVAKAKSDGDDDVKLTGAERKVLTLLAQHPTGLNKAQVALMTGYSAKSGGFRNTLSTLRVACRLEGDADRMSITPRGRWDLGAFTPLPKGRALLEYWMKRVDKCARAILETLAAARLKVPRGALAESAGYQATSGGFRNALSQLRTLGLIVGSAELSLSPAFVAAIL